MTQRQASIIRGVVAVLPLSIAGYALPVVALRGFDAILYGEHAFKEGFFEDIINSHRRLPLDDLKMIGPSLGCMLLFALTGFVNFTPRRFPGFLRTMIRIGGASIVGIFVMGFATMFFGLTTQSYPSAPHALKRLAIFAAVPLAYALWLLNRDIESAAQEIDEPYESG